MEHHNLPHDSGLKDISFGNTNMRGGESLFGPFDGELGQPSRFSSLTWTTPIDSMSATEDTSPAMAGTPENTEATHAAAPYKLNPSVNGPSSPPFDHLQTLYDAYHASYANPISSNSAHMQRAKQLALALLQRHYPSSRGYIVESTPLGPYSARGINFLLKDTKELDADPDDPPPMLKRAAKRTHAHDLYGAAWHFVEPDNMAAFIVKECVSDVDTGVEPRIYRAHTSLVIILDDLSTLRRWSRDNLNHRGDVLSDLLGVIGSVQKGHGMLLFGPRLELYEYDANDVERPVTPCRGLDWRMDMRTTQLATVDEVLKTFVLKDVVHRDDL